MKDAVPEHTVFQNMRVRGERGIQGSYTISDFIYFEVIINYEVTKLIFRKYLFGLYRMPLPVQGI